MYRRVVQQTVTYVQTCRIANRRVCTNVSYSKPSRMYRRVVQQTVTYLQTRHTANHHVTQQTVTHVQKCHKANRHVSSQTITYVQKCHTANHDVCVDVSHSKPSRMFKRVIQQTATSQRQLLRMNRHVIVTH